MCSLLNLSNEHILPNGLLLQESHIFQFIWVMQRLRRPSINHTGSSPENLLQGSTQRHFGAKGSRRAWRWPGRPTQKVRSLQLNALTKNFIFLQNTVECPLQLPDLNLQVWHCNSRQKQKSKSIHPDLLYIIPLPRGTNVVQSHVSTLTCVPRIFHEYDIYRKWHKRGTSTAYKSNTHQFLAILHGTTREYNWWTFLLPKSWR